MLRFAAGPRGLGTGRSRLGAWCSLIVFRGRRLILTQSSATASARCRKWMSGRPDLIGSTPRIVMAEAFWVYRFRGFRLGEKRGEAYGPAQPSNHPRRRSGRSPALPYPPRGQGGILPWVKGRL